MQPIYVTKNLIAASSAGIGSFSSAGAVGTLNSSSLGTGRRIIVWGSTSVATTFKITGTSESGTIISETITGSSVGSAVATTQDFLTVTAVTPGSTAITSTAGYIGTNTQGGTPWQVVDDYRNPINLGFNVTPTTTAVTVSLEYTFQYPSYVNGAWIGAGTSVSGPVPFISTACSSVTAATNGYVNFPVAAWRITLTSSSSSAGSAHGSVIQSG